jgi:hypothetical protein
MEMTNRNATLFRQPFPDPRSLVQMAASATDNSVQYARHLVAPAAVHPPTIALVAQSGNSSLVGTALASMQVVFAKAPME